MGIDDFDRVKVSKQIAYILRHSPSGMEISTEGFVGLHELLNRLRERWPQLDETDVRQLVERDPKGRYEICGEKIRARYGHSIDVEPVLTESSVKKLYHGTTSEAAQKILREGLKPKGRQKVHLSPTALDAEEVGRRRTENPTILEVDAEGARRAGVKIERASDKVCVSDEILPKFIERREDYSS